MLGDRMEMAHSIEGRVPFLDHKLVEVIRSQPVNQKIRGMTKKYVLREVCALSPHIVKTTRNSALPLSIRE
jgi:asparagine synthetase B (glutamine-hydrolysing)